MIVLNKDGVAYLWDKIRSSFAPKTEVPRGMAGMRWDTTGTQVDIPYMEIDDGGSVREYGTRRHTVSVGRVESVEPLDGTPVRSEPVFTVASQAALASMAQKTAWKVFVDASGNVTTFKEEIPCCSYEVSTGSKTSLKCEYTGADGEQHDARSFSLATGDSSVTIPSNDGAFTTVVEYVLSEDRQTITLRSFKVYDSATSNLTTAVSRLKVTSVSESGQSSEQILSLAEPSFAEGVTISTEDAGTDDRSVVIRFPHSWDDTSSYSGLQDKSIRFEDAAGTKIGELTLRASNKSTPTRMVMIAAYNPWKDIWTSLGVECSTSGSYTFAPTPAAGDSSTKIATTAFVSTSLPGKPVCKLLTLASNVACSTDVKEYDLSSYLPNDGWTYDVLLMGRAVTAATSGSSTEIRVYTDIVTSSYYTWLAFAKATSAVANDVRASCWMPVGAGRKVYVKNGAATGSFYLYARAYRKAYRI